MPIKVLVIDDDTAMTDLLSLLLQTNKFIVFTANNGKDGIKLIRSVAPDIVILDMMMPEMDGWQVCEEIRKFSDIPIVVLSALNKPGLVASALDAGADDYLIKPVPSNILIAHIKNLTKHRNTGNLQLSTASLGNKKAFS